MADGCAERFDPAFFWWLLAGGRTRDHRRHYRHVCEEHADKVVVCRNHADVKVLLERITRGSGAS